MRRRLSFAIGIAVAAASFHAVVNAQSPHGAPGAKPQAGPNVNAASGIVASPTDPAAFIKTDILQQRQNETVVAASTRNPDHILAAANDYRFVDFPQDANLMEQGFVTRLLAKLFFRSAPSRPPARATIGVGAWTGVYRSCDRGATHIGSAVPGSPLDSSPASMASPLKAFSNFAASIPGGGHAETTDPTLVAGPNGQMHLFVLGFIRKTDGSVLDGRMFHVSYTDTNNREGGNCFRYDYTVQFDRSDNYRSAAFPAPFLDKPSAAIDKDGTLYVSYTVFDDANNSRIVVARSSDGGISWTRAMPTLSKGFLRNHGTTMAVDPLSGEVFIAWRVFYQNWPLMVISRSPNGKVFQSATPISDLWPGRNLEQIVENQKGSQLQPFDQFNNAPGGEATARALAFPHLVAGVVNGATRLFVVWTERADVTPGSPTFGLPRATGSPRVMVSSSTNGMTWTPRRAIDAGPRIENSLQPGVGPVVTRPSGPQVQPAANISGTVNPQLMIAYYEARDELQAPYQNNFISGIERQMDVRIARVNPATLQLLAPSVQVSQYELQANTPEPKLKETAPGFSAVSRTNETMYGGGFKSFFGDYLTLASSTTLVGGTSWSWATEPSSVLAIWTDHRDVKFPFNLVTQKPDIRGRWDLYTPVTSLLADCNNTGMRNANPYFAEIGGVIAGAPQTFKPLNIQRAFATYVANQTPLDRFFRMRIEDNEGAGLDGSFNQFAFTAANDVRDVKVFGNSRHNQTVWVQPNPSNPTARLRIAVEEITAVGGTVKPDGLRTSIVLNPDPNNDALTPIPTLAPPFDQGPNSETHDPHLSDPRISTFKVHYPKISSPQIDTPQIDTHPATPQIDTPQIDTPQIDTHGVGAPQIDTHLSTPQIDTPQIDTPQIDTVQPDNGTDVTYTVTNGGTTNSVYKVGFNVTNVEGLINSGNYQFIVIVSKVSLAMSVQNTGAGCTPAAQPRVQVLANIPVTATTIAQLATLKNPQIDTTTVPDIATFTVAPFGGVAGQNGDGNDSYSTVLPDEVKITLRAIRMKTVATIISQGGPFFDPTGVVVRVESTSTNVVGGTVQPPGTQPVDLGAPTGVFLTQPSDGTRNGAITPAVRVLARDATGAVLPGVTVNLGFEANPGDAGLNGAAATTDASGVATFPNLAVTGAGSGYILYARVGDNVLGTSVPFNIVAGPLTFVVSNANDSGAGSLRQAIIEANANAPFADTIAFSLPSPFRITPATSLPAISDTINIDGTTLPGFGGANRVWVDGAGMPGAGFIVNVGAAGSTIRGLAITGFVAHGIRLLADGNTIASNLIGVAPGGAPAPNGEGIWVDGTKNNMIGGVTVADRNVISGNNGHGILIAGGAGATGNKVFNNYIGTSGNGLDARANGGNGVYVVAPSTIGAPGMGNVIAGNGQNGIGIDNADSGSTIQGNFIGVDALGTGALANALNGIQISDAGFSVIGGTVAGARNIISGNVQAGILLIADAGATTIQGNCIGLKVDGSGVLGNGGDGILADNSPAAMIGGTTLAARNVISGNGGNGVRLNDSSNSDVIGNYIGTDPAGTIDFGNLLNGVFVDETSNSRIGGTAAGAGNLISGNDEYGVLIDIDAGTNTVAGNVIGTNAAGTVQLHNGHNDPVIIGDLTHGGIRVDGFNNLIGVPTGGNLISGNNIGIVLNGGNASGNVIKANLIGLTKDGTAAIRNRKFGIFVGGATGTTIGGGGADGRNVISGNTLQAVYVTGESATGVVIDTNYIGTNAAGDAAVGNNQVGVEVRGGATGAVVIGNVISGNTNTGVRLEGGGNAVRGNLIGTDKDGTGALGNSGDGVAIVGSGNTVGGVGANQNTIAFNTGAGVSISGDGGNEVQDNSIYGNGGPGIDLGADGITDNDAGDVDTGANQLQNYPEGLDSNTLGNVSGILHSAPGSTYFIRVFLSPSCGANREGQTIRVSGVVNTDLAGDGPFNFALGPLTIGQGLTATATDNQGNTSEFSACATVHSTLEPAAEPPPTGRFDSAGDLRKDLRKN